MPKNRAHKIALWNSIVVGGLFCIITIAVSENGTIWNGAPAVLYYWINRAILTNENVQKVVSSSSEKVERPRPPQIAPEEETLKEYGNFNMYGSNVKLQTSTDMKNITFCTKCGVELLDGSQFCHRCGTSFADDFNTNPPVQVDNKSNFSQVVQKTYSKKTSKKTIMVVSVIAVIIALATCIVAVLLSKDNSEDKRPIYEKVGVTYNQYALAEIVSSDPETYCEYMVKLEEMLSKGSYGVEVQKEKAAEYLNSLPIDYGLRIILFRMQFPTDTTYCNDIVEFVNEREDISYDEAVFILEELGFAVFEDGSVKW